MQCYKNISGGYQHVIDVIRSDSCLFFKSIRFFIQMLSGSGITATLPA